VSANSELPEIAGQHTGNMRSAIFLLAGDQPNHHHTPNQSEYQNKFFHLFKYGYEPLAVVVPVVSGAGFAGVVPIENRVIESADLHPIIPIVVNINAIIFIMFIIF
jgi:hypothetical protein